MATKLSDSPSAEKSDRPTQIERRFESDIRDILAEMGLSEDVLLAAAMELYIPHPGIETKGKAEEVFKRELDIALSDPNLCILIYAGIQLEQAGEAGKLPNLSKSSYERDLTFLVCDEVLGMSISTYIAGHKGMFEYVRFDKLKPGVIKELGPFMDDVVAGLIGGVSSSMYTRGGV
ncbi:MAG: alpha-ribazole phosphatase CobZ [Methanosarcinales archaeon]|nr:alpha-ribazole phosphatase CobZ [Methanosarcinales archaeon]